MNEEDEVDGQEIPPAGEVRLPVVAPPSHSTALVARDDITVNELIAQSAVIEQAMKLAMTDGIHYGRIPGVNKPSLLKPGAEKLLVLFRLAPSYDSEKIWHDDGHLTVISKCRLTHIPTGLVIAEGEGLCTTRESRYAWRKGERICPECGEPQVREGKARDGKPGNWYCWRKQGGCGATWDLDSEQGAIFRMMETGRVANPDLADSFNTILKMSDKRSLLSAILNGTAASDVFTVDMAEEEQPQSARADWDSPSPPREPPPFNPATMLLPGAPTAKSGWKGIYEMLLEVEPSMDWGPIIRQAIAGVYGGDGDFRLLGKDQAREAAYRSANFAARLAELFAGETFLSNESIQRAAAEMFEGLLLMQPPPDSSI